MTELTSALFLSLRVAFVATLLAAGLAIPLAFCLARWRIAGRSIIEAALTVPLVLPPTVVGYFILVAAGTRSPLGGWIYRHLGYTLVFNWHGAVVAATVVALPLLYLPTRAAFAGVDRELEDVARLMGANLAQVFWHVSLPTARRGIGSGLLLAFARALGEFGATVMVLGVLPGHQTMPILIYTHYTAGEMPQAWAAVLILTLLSFTFIVIYNHLPSS